MCGHVIVLVMKIRSLLTATLVAVILSACAPTPTPTPVCPTGKLTITSAELVWLRPGTPVPPKWDPYLGPVPSNKTRYDYRVYITVRNDTDRVVNKNNVFGSVRIPFSSFGYPLDKMMSTSSDLFDSKLLPGQSVVWNAGISGWMGPVAFPDEQGAPNDEFASSWTTTEFAKGSWHSSEIISINCGVIFNGPRVS